MFIQPTNSDSKTPSPGTTLQSSPTDTGAEPESPIPTTSPTTSPATSAATSPTTSPAPRQIEPQDQANSTKTQETSPIPSPSSFNFTPSQALMSVVTLVGVVLIVQSLRRMGKKPKPANPALTGEMGDLLALRNEIYAKYPPPPRQNRTAPSHTQASQASGPTLRLVDDHRKNAETHSEIAALRQHIEQLTQELSHLQSRVRDLESSRSQQPTPTHNTAATVFTPPREMAPSANARSADHDNVYRLADRGMSAVEIAKTLGKHTGQVELILNLRRATGS
jgi:hypothetical protein